MLNGMGTGERVSRLEDGMANLTADVTQIGGKIDKLVDGLSSTEDKANANAKSVKQELREEASAKAKERMSQAMFLFGLLSAIALIVTALTGPWKEKLETTAAGQSADTAAVAAVREVLAQQGAAIGRATDSQEIVREKNKLQDAEILDLARDDSALKQALIDRRIPIASR